MKMDVTEMELSSGDFYLNNEGTYVRRGVSSGSSLGNPQAITLLKQASITSNIAYHLDPLSFSLPATSSQSIPLKCDTSKFKASCEMPCQNCINLTCKVSSSSTSGNITYSLGKVDGFEIPSWVRIDSQKEVLIIDKPTLKTNNKLRRGLNSGSQSTGYQFNVVSTVTTSNPASPGSTVSSDYARTFSISVVECNIKNCEQCSTTSNTKCSVCKEGYSTSNSDTE